MAATKLERVKLFIVVPWKGKTLDWHFSLFLCLQQNLPPSAVTNVGGKIFTFGSYRLGVHTKGMSTWYFIFFVSEDTWSFQSVFYHEPFSDGVKLCSLIGCTNVEKRQWEQCNKTLQSHRLDPQYSCITVLEKLTLPWSPWSTRLGLSWSFPVECFWKE